MSYHTFGSYNEAKPTAQFSSYSTYESYSEQVPKRHKYMKYDNFMKGGNPDEPQYVVDPQQYYEENDGTQGYPHPDIQQYQQQTQGQQRPQIRGESHQPQYQGQQQASQQENLAYVVEIDSKTHKDHLVSSSHVLVVKVYATWCEPCKEVTPHFEAMAQIYSPQGVSFASENVELGLSLEHVKGVPAFLFYAGGQYQGNVVGSNLNAIEGKIQQLMRGA